MLTPCQKRWFSLILLLGSLLWLWLSGGQPVLASGDRLPLTVTLLEERLTHPVLNDGALTIDLQNLVIDLTPENSLFRDQFYQQVKSLLSHSSKALGLDFSHSLIQGDFQVSRLGLYTQLTDATLPQNLSSVEQEQLHYDPDFLTENNGKPKTITVFRGLLKFPDALFTGKTDFSNTFFLQRVEGKDSKFTQEANWASSRFGRDVDLSGSIWGRDLNWSQSLWLGNSKFRQAQFQGSVDFNHSHFLGLVDFEQSQFFQVTNFTNVQWLKTVNFRQCSWRDRLLFSGSRFFQDLNLNGATLEKSAAFRYSRFSHLADLQDVKLLGQLDFSNAIFFPFAKINVAGLAFDSEQAKLLGDKNIIGKVLSLTALEGNETVIRNLVRNFRNLEQISDANQMEYTSQLLLLQQLNQELRNWPTDRQLLLTWLNHFSQWLLLVNLLLFSNYGTNVSLVIGIGMISIAFFGACFGLIDRVRRWQPNPILPSRLESLDLFLSWFLLTLLGLINVFTSTQHPWSTLWGLGLIILPLSGGLIFKLYSQGRYHDLLQISYFTQEGTLRQLRLLIVRLPIIPEFPFFRDRYMPLVWERRWNWLNYYDFSCNNFLKLGFNDIRLRDEHVPGLISILVWYQWSLGILYVTLLLWTLSRTIPGLNLLIYLS